MTDEGRPRNRRFRWIMGALAVVAVVSGGAAYAATQDDSPQARSQAIVDDAAGTLGVDPAKLSDALKAALQKQVDAQVTAGKLTQEQADAIKKRIADGTQPIFGGPGFRGPGKHFRHGEPGFGGGPGFGHHFGGPGLAAGVEEVATYLGLKPEELRTQLMAGKSLADIAKAQGKTVEGLKTAITDAVTKRLDAAVTAGKITKDQKAKLLDGLTSHLDDLVNGVRPPRGFGHGHWKGDKDGPPPVPADPPAGDPASWTPAPAAA
jgi:polyhydroxyalkanoate synthesis regulator phasin